MVTSCHICGHGEAFHNVFGVCNISDCGPCYKNLDCTRCKHSMYTHSISDIRIMCTDPQCKLLVCFDKKHPEKPLYTIINSQGKRVFERMTQPTYEEVLAHPLSPARIIQMPATTQTSLPIVSAATVVDDDPLIKPGVWKTYKPGREWVVDEGGYMIVDLDEKHENGSFKRHKIGRTWDTKLKGYVEDGPPPPPVKGFIDFA